MGGRGLQESEEGIARAMQHVGAPGMAHAVLEPARGLSGFP
ncbi:hypothetical protein D187_003856 [Cystobacter fuscus DSM 2262]|uniref:Uncharacterized protein n=1 Tax=Cystobacter fuscus (strain ATCC 25194 / DSM 2262 / NBRC 100088 / M29) TaxID=1242864 RepID=S9QQ00_CYSF2|nr:hypothetical protein D187_003856 [Cystobacter fuscus DSM 2262]